MPRKTLLTAAIFLGCSVLASIAPSSAAQSHNNPSREQATNAIRISAYEMMKAFLTVDVGGFKRRAARRTLQLVNLVYEAAREDPRFQEQLRTARITNSDEFLGYFMQGMATQYLQAVPLSPEGAARRVADGSIVSFISDSEAKIIVGDAEFARAKLVTKEWKIDLTDSLKKSVLKEVDDPAMRARIKSL
jgi:hypothetical protein